METSDAQIARRSADAYDGGAKGHSCCAVKMIHFALPKMNIEIETK
jgi:hypothetical protein